LEDPDKRTAILVVEDDAPLLQTLRDVLMLDGYDVVGVGDPSLVLNVAESVAPDLVIVDVMLPAVSGIELAAELRHSGFQDTPMIAITGSGLMLQVAAESDLFQAQFEKPLDFDDLRDCVDGLLDRAVDATDKTADRDRP
jgi:DNA-binding response OmpR family regulator